MDDASSPLLDRPSSLPVDLALGKRFQAKTLRSFGPTMDIRRSANREQEKGDEVVRDATSRKGARCALGSSFSSEGAAQAVLARPSE